MAVVFGAGGDAVRLIYYENQLKIEFFIDNDPEKQEVSSMDLMW